MMNIARSTLKIFSANILASVVSFLAVAFFARTIGPQHLGTLFLFQAVSNILVEFTDLGISGAVNKRLSEGKNRGSVIATGAVLKLTLTLLSVTGILILRQPINDYLGTALAMPLAVAVGLQHVTLLAVSIIRGDLRVGEEALPTLARNITYVSIAVVLIQNGYDFWGAIVGILLGSTVKLIWGVSKAAPTFGSPSVETAKSLVKFSQFGFISKISRYTFNWTDLLLIGLLLTNTEISLYEIPWRVTSVVMILSAGLSRSVFPQMSEWDSANSHDRIENLLAGAISTSAALTVPALFGVILFSEEILLVGFGTEYVAGSSVLIIVMGVRLVETVDTLLSQALKALDYPRLDAQSELLAIVVNIVLNVLFIYEYGILGAAVATLMTTVLKTVLHAYYLSKFLTLTFRYRALAAICCASLLMTGALVGVRSVHIPRTLIELVGVVMFGVCTYTVSLLLLPPTRRLVLDHARRVVLSE